jgi:hypothetical protein
MNNREETIRRIVNEAFLLEKKKKLTRRLAGFVVGRTISPAIERAIELGLDRETIFGMGGNAPVVGEYSGPQSQIK